MKRIEKQLKDILINYHNEFCRKHVSLPQIVIYDNKRMQIRNAKGTSHYKPWQSSMITGSWLNYWCAFAKDLRGTNDLMIGCYGSLVQHFIIKKIDSAYTKIEGAHVLIYEDGVRKEGLYIVPLCASCNSIDPSLDLIIQNGTMLVKMENPMLENS